MLFILILAPVKIMEKFIEQLVNHITDKHADLSAVTLVLPSQRAVRYIQRSLYQVLQKPFFSPTFFTIDEFCRSFVDVLPVDEVTLLFRFYTIYKKLGNEDDFETFLNWAPLLIADCNDIDRYMVDAKQLFKSLRDVRELEHWSFGEGRELSESQKQFLAFWDQLGDFYKEINVNFDQDKLGYAGSILRKAVLDVLSRIDDLYPNQHIIFAGFNALSEAELQLIAQLIKLKRADLILEADSFYLENRNHEAGMFIRKTKDRIPESLIFVQNELKNGFKEIVVTACAQSGSMLKVVQDLLSKLSPSDLNDTLLLLADESLIIPAIKHIPKSVGVANITLGLPLKLTAIRPWIELVFEFQRNFDYFKTDALYHKTLTAFFRHPFTDLILSDSDRLLIQKEEAAIIKYNKIFTKPDFSSFSSDMQRCTNLLLIPWAGDYKAAISKILRLNQFIFDCLDSKENVVERSACYHFNEVMQDLAKVFDQDGLPSMTLRTFEKFLTMRWIRETVAYYGNPVEGLQVMGMLETRMLNFKNVIVVGLNEGILPPKNMVNSLIPMDLRRFFSLPLPQEKDAIFAHHFYRLLAGVEKMHILYSENQGDDSNTVEPSRYLRQIELELLPVSNISLIHSTYGIPSSETFVDLSFSNSFEVKDRILDYFRRGLSPSALNKFLNCPLDFYLRYVLKYSDGEDVEEGIESSTFGDVVHRVLEVFYLPFVGEVKRVQAEDIDVMLKRCDDEVLSQFKKKFDTSIDIFDGGVMYFALLAARKQVRRYLNYERSLILDNPDKELFIVSLELEFAKEIQIDNGGKLELIRIVGKIDRVDRFDGVLRIIDYKTGKCDEKQVLISNDRCASILKALDDLDGFNFEEFKGLNSGYVFQLLFYLVLYLEEADALPGAIGILSLRNMKYGLQELKFGNSKKADAFLELQLDRKLAAFTSKYIIYLAESILKTDQFIHNSKSQFCILCNEH